ncbi:MAG: Acyl-CoA thioesterase [Candidatus Adlerbacteria bacterium]|nr:Acyl-CoA thioesterase [Candidatus Adlerbacteria bacterium]
MKTAYIIGSIILVAAIVVGYVALRPSIPTITNYPPHDGPIVAFGDSLVAGYGAEDGHGFVDDVSAQIGEPIVNLGVSGDTTAQGLARIDKVVALNPRIVIVLLGGNDYLRKVPRAETFANLRTIIDTLQAQGSIVVLLGVRGGLITDNFASEYAALAAQTHSVYVTDVLADLLGNKTLMYDEVHPNDAGYQVIAGRVSAALKPVLH